jgi:hypothetical protein
MADSFQGSRVSAGAISRRASGGEWLLAIVLALVLAGLALRAHRETLDYALVGFDTYPQIISARIESWSDFFDTFREELTEGRIEARFYRPIQNFSVALDYALFGLEPRGYHAVSLAALALMVVSVLLAVWRLLGSGSLLPAAIAAALVGLHPVLLNIVPTVCRRSELLLITFLMAMLAVLPQRGEGRVTLRIWVAGLLVLLAAGSKDIGVMGLGLVVIHQLFLRDAPGWRVAIRQAALAAVPALLATVAYLVNRTLVLQGFGGYQKTDKHASQTYLGNLAEFGRELLGDVFAPFLFFRSESFLANWSEIGVGVTLAGVWAGLSIGALAFCMGVEREERRRAGALIVLGLAWCVPLGLVLGLLNWYGSWYAAIPLVGVALTLAGLARLAISLAGGSLPECCFAGMYGGLVAAIVVLGLAASPLRVYYPEWRRATEMMDRELKRLDRELDLAANGTIIDLDIRPYYDPPEAPRDRMHLLWVATIKHQGVLCYAQLRHPHRNLRAALSQWKEGWTVAPNEVLIRCRHYSFEQE